MLLEESAAAEAVGATEDPGTAASIRLNRIDARFADLRASGRKGLIPYITAGDPDLETTRRAVLSMASAGADLIELGLPFSDPIADGPVIQRASERSLKAGFRLESALGLVRSLRNDLAAGSIPGGEGLPLIFMTYYNLVLHRGLDRFASEAAEVGTDGLIIPDLPLEESGDLEDACRRHGLRLIPLLAPTSTDARIEMAAATDPAFIYCVSVTGVTGMRNRLSNRLEEMVSRIRPQTPAPLAAGFGISGPDQVRDAARLTDAVIVGSAIVRLVEEGGTPEEIAARVGRFVSELKAAMNAAATRSLGSGSGSFINPGGLG